MSADYWEISIDHIARIDEENISELLFSLGASGVSENLEFVQTDSHFTPEVKEAAEINLKVYFPLEINTAMVVETVKSHYPKAQVVVKKEQSRDWLEEWKKGFESFLLCADIWVVPSWKESPPQAKQVISMEPGMAFGTGTHETTQICSQLIYDVLKNKKINYAFDLGTGTGILAILMAKLGVAQIGCCDIDEECRRVSQENFDKNNINQCVWYKEIGSDPHTKDLIVANIIDGVLLDLKSEIIESCNGNTHLILSGILAERESAFLPQFLKDTGFEVKSRVAKNEWLGFHLVRV